MRTLCLCIALVLLWGCDDERPRRDAAPTTDSVSPNEASIPDGPLSPDARGDAPPPDQGPGDDAQAPDSAAAGDQGPPPCTLAPSGPVQATADGQVIEKLKITATSGAAITVQGKKNVVIRDCEIHHDGGAGIKFSNADNILIEDVVIVHDGAPATGQNPGTDRVNIDGYSTSGVTIRRVRLIRGSTGIYLLQCPGAKLSFVEGHDFRGPFPRGQLLQLDKSDNVTLEDFSCVNPQASSWPEDNISVYQSSGATIRRGLLDGNNSPSGVGVMFEQSNGTGTGGLCEDVDAVHMGNGCFSGYPGFNVTFRRTRSRDNICADQGRGAPLSGGLAWAGSPASSGLSIEQSSYHDLCAGLVWDQSVFVKTDLTDVDFTPRAALDLVFCWSAAKP